MAAEVLSKPGSEGSIQKSLFTQRGGASVSTRVCGLSPALTEGGERGLVTARCSPFPW